MHGSISRNEGRGMRVAQLSQQIRSDEAILQRSTPGKETQS